jgi:hypothetical protein
MRPTGVAAVTGRYVLRRGSVSAVVARAQMRGNALALQEDLDRARRQPRLDLGPGSNRARCRSDCRARRGNRCRRDAGATRPEHRVRSARALGLIIP